MTEANKAIFEKNKHYWLTLRDGGYLRGLTEYEKNELTNAARQEFFGPGYHPDWWCPSCAAEAVRSIYTQYEKHLSNG